MRGRLLWEAACCGRPLAADRRLSRAQARSHKAFPNKVRPYNRNTVASRPVSVIEIV